MRVRARLPRLFHQGSVGLPQHARVAPQSISQFLLVVLRGAAHAQVVDEFGERLGLPALALEVVERKGELGLDIGAVAGELGLRERHLGQGVALALPGRGCRFRRRGRRGRYSILRWLGRCGLVAQWVRELRRRRCERAAER